MWPSLTHQLSALDPHYSQCCQGCRPLCRKGPAEGQLVPTCTVHRQEETNTEGGGGAKARQAKGLALHHTGQEGMAPCLQGQTALTQAPSPEHPHSHPSLRAPA